MVIFNELFPEDPWVPSSHTEKINDYFDSGVKKQT